MSLKILTEIINTNCNIEKSSLAAMSIPTAKHEQIIKLSFAKYLYKSLIINTYPTIGSLSYEANFHVNVIRN